MSEQLTREELAELRLEHQDCKEDGCEWGRFLDYIAMLEQELAEAVAREARLEDQGELLDLAGAGLSRIYAIALAADSDWINRAIEESRVTLMAISEYQERQSRHSS